MKLNRYDELRNIYPVFNYNGFDIADEGESLKIKYDFSIDGLCSFSPSFVIPKTEWIGVDETVKKLVFSLGLVELISYWKTCCPKKVVVKCGLLDEDAIAWWKKLYFNGLGEFFHVNGIECTENDFMELEFVGEAFAETIPNTRLGGYLVPVGGGKDSAVTLELLKNFDDVDCCIINSRGATDWCVEASKRGCLHMKRTLDKNMLELNKKGFLNGHTPFSAIVAFSTVLLAYLNGKRYVALSNESSANESTVPNSKVNHQYSKSFEFERDFSEYEKKYITSGVYYFSLLRPLSEYQIAKYFAAHKKYHPIFRSCNVGSKTDSWCGKCPKCLFVALMLSAHLGDDEIKAIFGCDILGDESLAPILESLVGLVPEKPFECVGSRSEVRASILEAIQKRETLPYLLEYYKNKVGLTDEGDYFSFVENEHNVPSHLLPIVLKNCVSFDGYVKGILRGRILILGYGREGKSTAALLDRLGIEYKVADKFEGEGVDIFGEGYQKAMDDFDIVMKSPGVVLEYTPNAEILSQVELFLQYFRHNTIGITGTKGKSTTTSLIYHVLKESGVKSLIAGNIGIPPFDVAEKVESDTVVVMELSSHQLEYAKTAPHTALYLNLYEEHLDHYGTFEKYKAAKENIYRLQKSGDLLYCHVDLYPRYTAICIGKDADIPTDENGFKFDKKYFTIDSTKTSLVGSHNILNVAFAYAVCSRYVSEPQFFAALKTFRPLPHRLESLGEVDGVTYYNDSISTASETVISALKSLPNTATLLLGGMDRGLHYDDLIEFLRTSCVENILLMADTGKRIFDTIKNDEDFVGRARLTPTLEEAVKVAKAVTPKGKICLLSPAAASYGIFKNFEHRGDEFRRLVFEK